MSRLFLLATIALLALAPPCAQAQAGADAQPPQPAQATVPLDHLPALRGGYFPLVAEGSGRTHHVYVRLPEGYEEQTARRWPVVYLLDGDSLFPLLAPTHLFLGYDEGLPEAIVVGIAYGGVDPAVNKREYDFTRSEERRVGEEGRSRWSPCH